MKAFPYPNFRNEVHKYHGVNNDSQWILEAACRLAYPILLFREKTVNFCSVWDAKLNRKYRAWVYLGLGMLLFTLVLLPTYWGFVSQKSSAPVGIMMIQIPPLEPLPAYDSILFNHTLNQLSHDKQTQ